MPKAKKIEPVKIPMMTRSGRLLDLNNLKPEDISVLDIAHSLSNLCRYNGHTERFYSVAEHSVRLARYAINNYTEENNYSLRLARALLLHDGTEGYVGDVIYHLKRELPQFSDFENKVAAVLNKKYEVDTSEEIQTEVASLDRRICFDEMYALCNGRIDPWFYENKTAPLGMEKLYIDEADRMGWTPNVAREKFLGMVAFIGIPSN